METMVMDKNSRMKLTENDLSLVFGGTFTKNKYPEHIYNMCGIYTKYHFFKKDEFFVFENGKRIKLTYDEANNWVRRRIHGIYEDLRNLKLP